MKTLLRNTLIILLTACATQTAYVPGLGEMMTLTSARHSKLWLAGQSQNWELANYELEEIHEGLEDAGHYHPTHKGIPGKIPDLIAETMRLPLQRVQQAITAKDNQKFIAAYDELTMACNTCHQKTSFGFNVIVRPLNNDFSNQSFKR